MRLLKYCKSKKVITVVLATLVAFTTILFSKPKTDVKVIETQKIEMINKNKIIGIKNKGEMSTMKMRNANITTQEIINKGRKLNLKCTAYCNDPITFTGEKPIINGTCAVDPRYIPFNSIIYIPSLNLTLRANDTGGKIKGDGRIDIYLKDYKTCMKFGIKDLEGYVLTPDMMK